VAMVFPIGDDNTQRRIVPVVTYGLIILNVAMFFMELSRGTEFIREWAFIPRQFSNNPAGEAKTIFTAMFMHAGWMHLLSNMLYLWIFGDNVEDNFGSLKFLLFYLASGIAATFAQFAVMPGANIPNLGASGAIAGVLAAYLILYPSGRVTVLTQAGMVQLPAILVLGLWIVLQLFSGIGSFTASTQTSETGGVAYMAHIGGFFAGAILAFLFRESRRV
jgi:membrane associated rhomboid family serine protease